jgi:predicted transposase YbfD/YdcC
MNEDQDRNRLSNGPHNLAELLHMEINAMRKEGIPSTNPILPLAFNPC